MVTHGCIAFTGDDTISRGKEYRESQWHISAARCGGPESTEREDGA